MPPSRSGASGLCQQFLRLWHKQEDTLFYGGQGGQPCQPLCRHEEEQRADGPCLLETLQHPQHGLTLLHGLWSRRPSRHGYFGFTNKLLKGEKIQIFNYGNCKRDFTYVDDIVEGVVRVMQHAPDKRMGEDGLPVPPYKVYNIGNNQPENLLDFVQILQEELLRAGVLSANYDFEAHKELVPMQAGDVPITYADTSALEEDFGFKPHTSLREGLRKFAEWYARYFGTNE